MRLISNKSTIALLLLTLFSAIINLTAISILDIKPVSDAVAYMKMATSMLNTGYMDDGQGNIAFYSSGYPLFLIPFFSLFDSTASVAQFVNVFLGISSTVLVYYCSLKLLPSWQWASIPAIIWTTYPPSVLYTEYIAKENLMIPLLLLQTLALLNFTNASNKHFLSILLGIIFGFELLVGSSIVLTGTVIALIITGCNINKKPFIYIKSWQYGLLFIIGVSVTLTPWLFYTHSKLGKPVLNTNSGFNLYLGNNENSDVFYDGIQKTPIGPQWQSIRAEKGELKSTALLKEKAIEHILDNPGKTAWRAIRKIIFFWNPPLHEGKKASDFEKKIRFLWLCYYLFIVSAALIPLIYFKTLNKNHFILYGTVFLYCFIHAAAYIIFRYRIPIMPFLSILAIKGVYILYHTFFTKHFKNTHLS